MNSTENDFSATLPAAWLLTEPPGDLCARAADAAAPGVPTAAPPGARPVPRPRRHGNVNAGTWSGAAGGLLALLRHWAGRPLRCR
ncbi:MAG: hypothetical protein ACK4PH_08005 [Aquincola tertiaricarbonis]